MSPPTQDAAHSGITGTRTNAEIRKATATRFQAAARVAGIGALTGWQIRSLMGSLIANGEQPTDEDLMRSLMAAPWFPKPKRRHWRVGEGGGWAVRS